MEVNEVLPGNLRKSDMGIKGIATWELKRKPCLGIKGNLTLELKEIFLGIKGKITWELKVVLPGN